MGGCNYEQINRSADSRAAESSAGTENEES